MIPFNIPFISGDELQYIQQAISNRDLTGDGHFTNKCQKFLEKLTNSKQVLLTSSCTHALEMCALLADIQPGDEVIMPSFTFVSSANAFVLRGAKIVFVDIRPDTLNIDEQLIESAVTEKTKAILVMHYAGVACEMDTIMSLADKHDLIVIEDAAQCIGAYYKNKHLGAISHLGTFSFHSTKNIHCGEGGALLINDQRFAERAEILRDKGTNRDAFLKGMVDKYTWIDIGSSYSMSQLNAAFLYTQLLKLEDVTKKRRQLFDSYVEELQILAKAGLMELPEIPDKCLHNGHIFYIKCKDQVERAALIRQLKNDGISSAFHYIPLHSAKAGRKFGEFAGEDNFTTSESEKILRLPLYFDLDKTRNISKSLKKIYALVWK